VSNREAIKAGLKALYRSGDVVEIRAFDRAGGQRPTLTGRYKYGAGLLDTLVQLDDAEYDLYYVLNPTPLLESPMSVGEGTKEADVLTRRYIFMDGDSVRHTVIGEKLNKKTGELIPVRSTIATDAECQAAIDVMTKVRIELTERGWNGIVQGCSGNGCHLLLPVDLPNLIGGKGGKVDEEIKTLITTLQRILSVTYSTADIKIECFPDASRLTRAYGSLNRKAKESRMRSSPTRTVRPAKVRATRSCAPVITAGRTAKSMKASLTARMARQSSGFKTAGPVSAVLTHTAARARVTGKRNGAIWRTTTILSASCLSIPDRSRITVGSMLLLLRRSRIVNTSSTIAPPW
jgi:hypothetical protein